MKALACPECHATSAIEGKGIYLEEASGFERRGKVGRRAVFKCASCEAILLVRVGLFGRVQAEAVGDAAWEEMEVAWQDQRATVTDHRRTVSMAESDARHREQREQRAREQGRTAECPICGKFLKSEDGVAAHLASVHPTA